MLKLRNFLKTFIIVLFSTLIGILFCELILRIKHHYVIDYDVEMWKYAKKLKVKVENEKINHVHIKNKSSKLQNVVITTNNHGQRGVNYNNKILEKFEKRFLILGSSITLGWGVENEKTFVSHLNNSSKEIGNNWIFVNGGVGNYNTERYINNYFENWSKLSFTDIVVHFFVNDTEIIKETKSNFLLTHTHLGVVAWKLINSYISNFESQNLKNYYKERYNDEYPGFKVTKKELTRLKNHCNEKKINCYIVLMPDIHKLNPYELTFINEKIKNLSSELNFPYLDLLPSFEKMDEKKVWNKYNDPHPNEYGHQIIGKAIFKFLNK